MSGLPGYTVVLFFPLVWVVYLFNMFSTRVSWLVWLNPESIVALSNSLGWRGIMYKGLILLPSKLMLWIILVLLTLERAQPEVRDSVQAGVRGEVRRGVSCGDQAGLREGALRPGLQGRHHPGVQPGAQGGVPPGARGGLHRRQRAQVRDRGEGGVRQRAPHRV